MLCLKFRSIAALFSSFHVRSISFCCRITKREKLARLKLLLPHIAASLGYRTNCSCKSTGLYNYSTSAILNYHTSNPKCLFVRKSLEKPKRDNHQKAFVTYLQYYLLLGRSLPPQIRKIANHIQLLVTRNPFSKPLLLSHLFSCFFQWKPKIKDRVL
jgi:hypothetical protein